MIALIVWSHNTYIPLTPDFSADYTEAAIKVLSPCLQGHSQTIMKPMSYAFVLLCKADNTCSINFEAWLIVGCCSVRLTCQSGFFEFMSCWTISQFYCCISLKGVAITTSSCITNWQRILVQMDMIHRKLTPDEVIWGNDKYSPFFHFILLDHLVVMWLDAWMTSYQDLWWETPHVITPCHQPFICNNLRCWFFHSANFCEVMYPRSISYAAYAMSSTTEEFEEQLMKAKDTLTLASKRERDVTNEIRACQDMVERLIPSVFSFLLLPTISFPFQFKRDPEWIEKDHCKKWISTRDI